MYNKLKNIRKSKNVSAAKLASMINLETVAAYTKKENGKIKFSLREAMIIATYFDMSVEELFVEEIPK